MTTMHPTPFSAMERVLSSIPEIHEEIFLHLDMTTLLVSAQRVNTRWRDIISTSPRLQRALFFRPDYSPASSNLAYDPDMTLASLLGLSADDQKKNSWPVLNRLLIEKFGPCFFDFGDTYGFLRRATSFHKLPWGPWPTGLGDVTSGAPTAPPSPTTPSSPTTPTSPASDTSSFSRDESSPHRRFTRRDASWRRMLVCQPPIPRLGFLKMDIYHFFRDSKRLWTSQIAPDAFPHSGGVRMGELYDLVQYHTGHHAAHTGWFRVLWGRFREPYITDSSRRTCQDLLEKTTAVLEIYHTYVNALAPGKQPADPAVFDAEFRCEGFRQLEFRTETHIATQWEHPKWDVTRVIR